ncbi:MAG: hypothetical protein KF708_16390 [Pirellulales bacterium]|nr:hypothetical protein [Pirellulales bacterium]
MTIARRDRRALLSFCAPIVTGALLALTFPPFDQVYLTWIALVPFAYVLRSRANGAAIYGGVALGALVYFLIGLDWMRTCYGGCWLSPSMLRLVLLAEWGAACAVVSCYFMRRFAQRVAWHMVFVLPVAVVAMQYFTWFAGCAAGGAPFPWLQIGLPAIQYIRLAQIADLGGVWLVTFVIAAINGALFDMARLAKAHLGHGDMCWSRMALPALTAFLLLGACFVYGDMRLRAITSRVGPRVCLMPSEQSPVVDLTRHGEAPRIALPPGHVDVLLWPENCFGHVILDVAVADIGSDLWHIFPEGQITDGGEKRVLERLSSAAEATLFVGAHRLTRASDGNLAYCNSIACVHPTRGYLGAYDKHYLVPWSEKIPFSSRIDLDLGLYSPGTESPIFSCAARQSGESFHCAAAICYDAAFPAAFRLSNYAFHPDFFLMASSEAFERTGRLQACMLQAVRFRAIENRRAIVRNVNGGRSGIVDATGSYRDSTLPSNLTEPTVLRNVPIYSQVSLYTSIGDWAPITCLALILTSLTTFRWKAKKHPPDSSVKESQHLVPASEDGPHSTVYRFPLPVAQGRTAD